MYDPPPNTLFPWHETAGRIDKMEADIHKMDIERAEMVTELKLISKSVGEIQSHVVWFVRLLVAAVLAALLSLVLL